jgi:hypothetical protein
MKSLDLIDVILGTVAGTGRFQTEPLWLFLKGPVGGGKTEGLTPLYGHPLCHFSSTLSKAALLSSHNDPLSNKDHSLLAKLNGKTFLLKDFTPILEMRHDVRDEIYGLLRDAYDGYISKEFGNGRREYKTRFNMLAGVTRAIEKQYKKAGLGERFLSFRVECEHLEQAKRAIGNVKKEVQMRKELQEAAWGVLANLPSFEPEIPATMEPYILKLAWFLARLRTYIERDGYRREVEDMADIEVPTRISKQLCRLGLSVAFVRHKKVVGNAEFNLMRKVALDSIPTLRRRIFEFLYESKEGVREDAVMGKFGICNNPAHFQLEDLRLLGLAVRGTDKMNHVVYRLTAQTREEWRSLRVTKV